MHIQDIREPMLLDIQAVIKLNHSNGDVRDDNGNHPGNYGGGIADFRQR